MIHHATQSRAHREGLHIEEADGIFAVYRAEITNGKDEIDVKLVDAEPLARSHSSAKEALEAAKIRLIDVQSDTVEEVATSEATEDDEQPAAQGSVVAPTYKQAYGVDANNGDNLAQELTAALKPDGKFNPEAYRKVCTDNDIDPERWLNLNIGMRSMNLRNALRNRIKHDKPVVVNGVSLTKDDIR